MRTPGLPTTAALAVALLAVSSSAPLIAYAAAPALAIAFWRNALAVGALAPVALTRRRHELRGLDRRTAVTCVLAGVALAAHFATWVPSAKLTTAATATALVATQPVWAALIAVATRIKVAGTTWAGILVAVAGAALATGADLAASRRAVTGDLLAIVGGAAAAVYTTLGERARARASTTAYTTVCYAVCAVLLGAVCLVGGVPLHGFDGRTWLAIAALTVGAQLLGHSLVSYALHRVSATTVSVLLLMEVPGAALLAWGWLGQTPPVRSLPGLALLVAGVFVVVIGAARRGAATTAADAAVGP
ncbi:DMT family transporter [Planosporangium thailandense]|uniref:DMT family transporter n=1 Tax=Planosporangium thailandense TaxID=765197 RepID=A0ABX0XVM7_9ACTN|nr:DMT family transporter [Planosporangium thailandense]